jgi:hypothetical protein
MHSITASSKDIMGSTGLTFSFHVPTQTVAGSVKDSDYVAVDLPHNWGTVDKFMEGKASVTATLTGVTGKTYKFDNYTVSSNSIRCNMGKTSQKITENQNYTLTLSGVPTPMTASTTPGSLVVSIGK